MGKFDLTYWPISLKFWREVNLFLETLKMSNIEIIDLTLLEAQIGELNGSGCGAG